LPGPFAFRTFSAMPRIDRFKHATRAHVRDRLLGDEIIVAAVARHAAEHGVAEADVWRQVRGYIQEIVPFFNVVAYYHVGYRLAGWLLNLFYKVSVDLEPHAGAAPAEDAVLIYVMPKSARSTSGTSMSATAPTPWCCTCRCSAPVTSRTASRHA
jgi:hypothetical protein